MKKMIAGGMFILSLTLSFNVFAAQEGPVFVGTWSGDNCTMNSQEGLSCGKPAEIVVEEQKNNLVRGYIKISGKAYPLSGISSPGNRVDYTDSLGTTGVLVLTAEKDLQMRALNHCLTGRDSCAHLGVFKRRQ